MKTVQIKYEHSDREPVTVVEFGQFVATGVAYATSRCLNGSDDFWAACEYAEPGTVVVDGTPRSAVCIYLFSEQDIRDDDDELIPEDCYPFDADHCARILLRD